MDEPFDVQRGVKHPHYHNILIETFATQGGIVLISYIIFLFLLFKETLKNYYQETREEIKNIRLLSIGVLIFITLYGIAEPIFYFTKIYMVLFTILTLNFIRVEDEEKVYI